ncbi:MAG: DUF616 domain-containing protein [Prevotella sp.]|nr:DUF616 domain-containing protein [Prevotella sp.]
MNNKVIYTCLVGGYDDLLQPKFVDADFDYVCFTDHVSKGNVGVWQMRKIPPVTGSLTRLSRYPKLLPHELLQDYEYSVYMDANVQIVRPEFYEVVNEKIRSGCLVAQVWHVLPPVDCIYDEIGYAYKLNRVTFRQAWKQSRYLRQKHFPRHYGLFENNLLFRRHLDQKVITMSKQWWDEYNRHAPRDQFSLMFVYWQNGYMPDDFFDEGICTRNCPWLSYHQHHWEQQASVTFLDRIHWHAYPFVKRLL